MAGAGPSVAAPTWDSQAQDQGGVLGAGGSVFHGQQYEGTVKR